MDDKNLKTLITEALFRRRLAMFDENGNADREGLERLKAAVIIPFEVYKKEYKALESSSLITGKILVEKMIDSHLLSPARAKGMV